MKIEFEPYAMIGFQNKIDKKVEKFIQDSYSLTAVMPKKELALAKISLYEYFIKLIKEKKNG